MGAHAPRNPLTRKKLRKEMEEKKRTYEEGYQQGIKDASPWILVNEMNGTEWAYGGSEWGECDLDGVTVNDVVEEFEDAFEEELTSLIDNYLDLSEYDLYDDFKHDVDSGEVDVDPCLDGLWELMYVNCRYTDDTIQYTKYVDIFDYIEENWEGLK